MMLGGSTLLHCENSGEDTPAHFTVTPNPVTPSINLSYNQGHENSMNSSFYAWSPSAIWQYSSTGTLSSPYPGDYPHNGLGVPSNLQLLYDQLPSSVVLIHSAEQPISQSMVWPSYSSQIDLGMVPIILSPSKLSGHILNMTLGAKISDTSFKQKTFSHSPVLKIETDYSNINSNILDTTRVSAQPISYTSQSVPDWNNLSFISSSVNFTNQGKFDQKTCCTKQTPPTFLSSYPVSFLCAEELPERDEFLTADKQKVFRFIDQQTRNCNQCDVTESQLSIDAVSDFTLSEKIHDKVYLSQVENSSEVEKCCNSYNPEKNSIIQQNDQWKDLKWKTHLNTIKSSDYRQKESESSFYDQQLDKEKNLDGVRTNSMELCFDSQNSRLELSNPEYNGNSECNRFLSKQRLEILKEPPNTLFIESQGRTNINLTNPINFCEQQKLSVEYPALAGNIRHKPQIASATLNYLKYESNNDTRTLHYDKRPRIKTRVKQERKNNSRNSILHSFSWSKKNKYHTSNDNGKSDISVVKALTEKESDSINFVKIKQEIPGNSQIDSKNGNFDSYLEKKESSNACNDLNKLNTIPRQSVNIFYANPKNNHCDILKGQIPSTIDSNVSSPCTSMNWISKRPISERPSESKRLNTKYGSGLCNTDDIQDFTQSVSNKVTKENVNSIFGDKESYLEEEEDKIVVGDTNASKLVTGCNIMQARSDHVQLKRKQTLDFSGLELLSNSVAELENTNFENGKFKTLSNSMEKHELGTVNSDVSSPLGLLCALAEQRFIEEIEKKPTIITAVASDYIEGNSIQKKCSTILDDKNFLDKILVETINNVNISPLKCFPAQKYKNSNYQLFHASSKGSDADDDYSESDNESEFNIKKSPKNNGFLDMIPLNKKEIDVLTTTKLKYENDRFKTGKNIECLATSIPKIQSGPNNKTDEFNESHGLELNKNVKNSTKNFEKKLRYRNNYEYDKDVSMDGENFHKKNISNYLLLESQLNSEEFLLHPENIVINQSKNQSGLTTHLVTSTSLRPVDYNVANKNAEAENKMSPKSFKKITNPIQIRKKEFRKKSLGLFSDATTQVISTLVNQELQVNAHEMNRSSKPFSNKKSYVVADAMSTSENKSGTRQSYSTQFMEASLHNKNIISSVAAKKSISNRKTRLAKYAIKTQRKFQRETEKTRKIENLIDNSVDSMSTHNFTPNRKRQPTTVRNRNRFLTNDEILDEKKTPVNDSSTGNFHSPLHPSIIDKTSVTTHQIVKNLCKLTISHLQIDGLRVLTVMGGLFYAGRLSPIEAPDVYAITLDGERGNKPHIFSREEILRDTILEIRPKSVRELHHGTRLCAYWSGQYRCLYPGTSVNLYGENLVAAENFINIEFDDGDSGRILVDDIRLLPPAYPIIEYDPNPLLSLTKKRRKISKKRCQTTANDKVILDTKLQPASQFPDPFKCCTDGDVSFNGKQTFTVSNHKVKKLKRKHKDRVKLRKQIGQSKRYNENHRKHKHKKHRKRKLKNAIINDNDNELRVKRCKLIGNEIENGSELQSDKNVSHHSKISKEEESTQITEYGGNLETRNPRININETMSKIAAFLPVKQLWNWIGKGYRRPGAKGRAKKQFFKGIKRGNESIEVGDSAVFLSTSRADRPYIGRIQSMWETTSLNMIVKVKWFYHPEETIGCPRHFRYQGALFESPHTDENDVQTISHKCDVLTLQKYIEILRDDPQRYLTIYDNNDIYYLAGHYDPTTHLITFQPGIIDSFS